jgi:cysteine synthase B
MGVGRRLKEHKPAAQIVAVEPTVGHKIQGLKNMEESIVPAIYQPEKLDRKITVKDEDAFEMTRVLAQREGLFVGMSSGAAVVAAVAVARDLAAGTVVVLICDRGDRYLSTNLFTSICAQCPP